jgi:hypothetical protein
MDSITRALDQGPPSNHSPRYAPVLHPTLKTGLQAMPAGAGARLAAGAEPAA